MKAVVRELLAGVKRLWARQNHTLTSAGTQPDYTLAPTTALTAYVKGHRFGFKVHSTLTGAGTLNVSTVAAKKVFKIVGTTETQIGSGDWYQNQRVEVVYDTALDGGAGGWWWINQTPSTDQLIPTGAVMPFAGSTAPSGWLLCYGQAVSRTTYATLFALIGTTYGAGDTTTTFNVPDLRGRAVFGQDNMGGSAASRVTNAVSGIDAATLGASGGNQNMHGHVHGVTDPTHAHQFQNGLQDLVGGSSGIMSNGSAYASTAGLINAAATGISIQTAGSGSSQNMPPTLVLNYIIKI